MMHTYNRTCSASLWRQGFDTREPEPWRRRPMKCMDQHIRTLRSWLRVKQNIRKMFLHFEYEVLKIVGGSLNKK